MKSNIVGLTVMGGLLATLAAAGCGFLFPANPRPDDPNAVRPSPPVDAVGWTSLAWQTSTFEDPPNDSVEDWDQAAAVAATSDSFVAVGSNWNVMNYRGRIWRSGDSLDWRLVTSELLSGVELVDVASSGNAYVAIGTRLTDRGDVIEPTSALLASPDGLSWRETMSLPGAWAVRVSGGLSGFAVVIEVGDASDLLFSPDGETWTRVSADEIAPDTWIADIAADGTGWLAAGRSGNRAVVLRSADGKTWREDQLPASEPVPGIAAVSANRVIPGQWAAVALGADRRAPCENEGFDEEECTVYPAAWSWTAMSGWRRLPKANWIVGASEGGTIEAAGAAGFVVRALTGETRLSPDGWEWGRVEAEGTSGGITQDLAVTQDRLVAVGVPFDMPSDDQLVGWFGSAQITR